MQRNINHPTKINIKDKAFISYLIGIFLLASAPTLALFFLIFPIFASLKNNYKKFFKDKLNFLLLAISFIIILKSLITSYIYNNELENWDSILNWAGLGNWIPLFLIFLGSQKYLEDLRKRNYVVKVLILGTLPVIFSCLSQYFLKWYGPYELLNGLVIWYQRPINDLYQPISGLFNNPNYTGAWLSMVWPFLLTYMNKKKDDKNKFLIVFCFSVLYIFTVSLINSRGAWLGILIAIPFIYGRRVLIWLIPFVIVLSTLIITCSSNLFPESAQNIFCMFIPKNLMTNFNSFSFSYDNLPRFLIWDKALQFISEKPFFGWGAASFPTLFHNQTGNWIGHPHNLFLELSISYGLIVSILMSTFIFRIIYESKKTIFFETKNQEVNFDNAWLAAALIFLVLHLFDIVYFDFRISIIFWTLLAGLKCASNRIDAPTSNR